MNILDRLDIMGREGKTPRERFWEMVGVTNGDKCWEWLGAVHYIKGYGHFKLDGKDIGAHRISWIMFNKKNIDEDLLICHTCDNPSCVNPNHLFIGTSDDNNKDRTMKGRTARGEHSHLHKLMQNDILEIRNMYESGEYSYMDLSKKFGVCKSNIASIIRKESWGWL